MNGSIGFCLGISLGTVLLTASLAAERKRTRQALMTMVDRGQLRVQTSDGQPVNGDRLVLALDATLKDPDAKTAGRDRKLAIAVVCLCAVVFAATVARIITRF